MRLKIIDSFRFSKVILFTCLLCVNSLAQSGDSKDFIAPVTASLDSWIKQGSVHLHYQLTGQSHRIPYSLPGDMFWQITDNQYKIKFEISHFLMGSRTQISEGLISTDGGILPERFLDKIRNEDQVTFNRTTHLLQFSNKSSTEPLEASAQDQLSVIYQLGYWIAKNQDQIPKGAKIRLQLVSKNNAESREFQYLGSEFLDLPIARVETFKIIRVPRSADDQKATVWLLKNAGLTLGRIRLEEENGDFVDQKLSHFELVSGLK